MVKFCAMKSDDTGRSTVIVSWQWSMVGKSGQTEGWKGEVSFRGSRVSLR